MTNRNFNARTRSRTGGKARVLTGTVDRIQHVGTADTLIIVVEDDQGQRVSVPCFGLLRRQAEGVEPGDRITLRESRGGVQTLTVEGDR